MNINDSTDLIMKQFEVNGSCKGIPETENNIDSIDGCVGYACLPGNIYQETDTYNTFHNYLVLQDTEPLTACTENHQVYNNWTKRKLPEHPMERRDVGYVGTFGQNIPKLQFNTCTFKKSSNESKIEMPPRGGGYNQCSTHCPVAITTPSITTPSPETPVSS